MIAVRALDEIIDHQKYPVKLEVSTKAKKSWYWLHWLAHYLAKNKVQYSDKEA